MDNDVRQTTNSLDALRNSLTERLHTIDMSSIEGKFLTFVLCNEEYGLEILKVREINGLMEITPVPQMPDYVKGVINLRGKVIPIIDLRLKFSMPEAEYTKETCIIVVDVQNTLVGIIVDTVSEVIDVNASDIEPPPRMGHSVNTDFILGLAKIRDKVKILLDIEKVLQTEELTAAEHAALEHAQ